MSGHSKWSKIHRQKEVADAKRGRLFTKLGRAISVAVREGEGVTDPDANFQLRLAVEKAKQYNMPKVNIERAIQRGVGKGEESRLEEIIYEGYGPEGTALLIKTTTDNKQRTGQEIKNIFTRGGGSLAGPGSVSYQFETQGSLLIEKPSREEAILKLIDLGVRDFEESEDEVEIYVEPEKLETIKQKLDEAGYKIKSYELSMEPKNLIKIGDKQKAIKVLNFMEKLQEHDDVQKVFANFDIPDEILDQIKK